tara:strand:- start:1772 stop:3886 length:2115 start_codon:yes stop_codon:yes gene_type:complete
LARLLNIRTDLSNHKSPQYGYDRRGAGPRKTNASGQPYEVQEIPKRSFNESDYNKGLGPKQSVDFLLRGGQLLPEITSRDVSRLNKMFTDLKSPNGLLFTTKQEVLSRTGVNVLATSNSNLNSKNRRALNNGVYLPTSTLAQVAVNPIGGHLLKQGIDPTASTGPDGGILGGVLNDLFGLNVQDPLGNPTYFSTVAYSERRGGNETNSRLVGFTKFNINENTNSDNELYNYSGGPGSILGVGKTSIKMPNDQRTGINNSELRNSNFFTSGKTLDTNFGFNYSVFRGGTTNPNFETFRGGTYFGNIEASGSKSVTGKYATQTNTPIDNLLNDQFKITNDNINGAEISKVGQSVYQIKNGVGFQSNTPGVNGLGSSLTYNQLMTAKGTGSVVVGSPDNLYPGAQILEDFRKNTNAESIKSPDYTISTNRYEERVKLGDAGKQLPKNTSYVKGVNYGKNGKEGLDKINALQIYKSNNIDPSKEINDLCKFRIGVIDNDNPSLKTYIHFRAFIDSMDDNYTAEWSSQKFAGRAENLHNYQGFDRKFNLSWTVAAQSKQELIPMYQKLNYLASVCAPDYSSDGYMRGNLIELTVGGYLFNQVGIMTGINYTVPMESPWEIAINDTNAGSDKSVKELPFMIKVSGFSFIPIHNFVPNVQKNQFSLTNTELLQNISSSNANPGQNLDTVGDLATFGDERYIALSNGFNPNY